MQGKRYQHVRTFSRGARTKNLKKGKNDEINDDIYSNDGKNNNEDSDDNDDNENINNNNNHNDNNDISSSSSTRRLYVLPSYNLKSITHENHINPIRVRERVRERGSRKGVRGGERVREEERKMEREVEIKKGGERGVRGRGRGVELNMLTQHISWFNFNDVKFTKIKDKKVNFSVNSNNDNNITSINYNTNTPNYSIQQAMQHTTQQTVVVVEDLALHHYLHILASQHVQHQQYELYGQYGIIHFLPSNESLKKNSVEVFTNDRNASISGRVIQYQYNDKYGNKNSNNNSDDNKNSNKNRENNNKKEDDNQHRKSTHSSSDKHQNEKTNGYVEDKIHNMNINTSVGVDVDVCVCGVWVGCWSEGVLWTQILFLLMWDQVNRMTLLCVMLCYVMLCYVMLCYVMLCYVMLYYAMLCYVILYYVML